MQEFWLLFSSQISHFSFNQSTKGFQQRDGRMTPVACLWWSIWREWTNLRKCLWENSRASHSGHGNLHQTMPVRFFFSDCGFVLQVAQAVHWLEEQHWPGILAQVCTVYLLCLGRSLRNCSKPMWRFAEASPFGVSHLCQMTGGEGRLSDGALGRCLIKTWNAKIKTTSHLMHESHPRELDHQPEYLSPPLMGKETWTKYFWDTPGNAALAKIIEWFSDIALFSPGIWEHKAVFLKYGGKKKGEKQWLHVFLRSMFWQRLRVTYPVPRRRVARRRRQRAARRCQRKQGTSSTADRLH